MPSEGPSGRPLPLSVRLLGAGVRGARTVTKATGIDRAVEVAAEEAMVAAVESEAVERALARVLQGPLVEQAVEDALESEAIKRALIEALDSELVDEVWRRMLASEETQRLIERIAEAPELRAAISAQSMGFIEDVGHTVGNTTRRLDGIVERIARRLLFRPRRLEPTNRAGALTRALAFGLDILIVNLAFSGLAAIVALIGSALSSDGNSVSPLALALGTGVWMVLGAVYLVGFWSLVGETPGMRFFGIRLGVERGLPVGRSIKRLFGFALAVIPLGLGFVGILFDGRRRGWQDRLAGVDVIYVDRHPDPAPWSTLEVPAPIAAAQAAAAAAAADPGMTAPATVAPGTMKAPAGAGLHAQQVVGGR